MFKAPHIVFVFADHVPSTVKDDLEALGIEVRGDVVRDDNQSFVRQFLMIADACGALECRLG